MDDNFRNGSGLTVLKPGLSTSAMLTYSISNYSIVGFYTSSQNFKSILANHNILTVSHFSATAGDDNPKCFQVFPNVPWKQNCFCLKFTKFKLYNGKKTQSFLSHNLDMEIEAKKKKNHSIISESK